MLALNGADNVGERGDHKVHLETLCLRLRTSGKAGMIVHPCLQSHLLGKLRWESHSSPGFQEPDRQHSKTPCQGKKLAGRWLLTPVILATPQDVIRRIAVQSQCRQIVHKTLSQKKPNTHQAPVTHTCNPSYSGG
jgi:hypothetical protein